MPQTNVLFYQDDNGQVPVLEWLWELKRRNRKAYAKCVRFAHRRLRLTVARIRRLAELGHELRRPESDYLRDDIYELRAKLGRVNYRILYFFYGQNVAILDHAITKEGKIPDVEINRAIRRKEAFFHVPESHSYEEVL
jgi:phage-related protein